MMAIKEAELARKKGDYAVGAVLVKGNRVLAKFSNRSKREESPIAHAEVLAIVKGSKVLKRRHLSDCILYCTHEPCPMCASVIIWARLKGVIYGATQKDMKNYSKNFSNGNYLWRTIDIPCRVVFAKATEKVSLVGKFLRDDCIKLFHNA